MEHLLIQLIQQCRIALIYLGSVMAQSVKRISLITLAIVELVSQRICYHVAAERLSGALRRSLNCSTYKKCPCHKIFPEVLSSVYNGAGMFTDIILFIFWPLFA